MTTPTTIAAAAQAAAAHRLAETDQKPTNGNVARRLGVSERVLDSYRGGHRTPPTSRLVPWAASLKVSFTVSVDGDWSWAEDCDSCVMGDGAGGCDV